MTDDVRREVLPIPDRPYDGPIFEDAKDPAAKFPPIAPLRPPAGAPNILIVLIDDAGFGCSSAFGGPCRTPTAERLAKNGLKYNRFHTTALCSPTRAAMLSGRNHHAVGMGAITEVAISVMPPIPTAWWLRPESIAARVGEHSAVVWKRLYLSPAAASRSAVGVRHGPPNALDAPKPTSSSRITTTFGAPAGGRSRAMGANFVSGSLAS